jgi:hypothetical protein
MAGRPPPLAVFGQGPYQGAAAGASSNNENEEVWEVPLNLFNKPSVGNRVELGNTKRTMSLFNEPGTPKNQVRVAANWWAPPAPNVTNPAAGRPWRVHPKVFTTPQRPIRKQVPKTPRKPTGAERRSRKYRKSRRNTRRLRK